MTYLKTIPLTAQEAITRAKKISLETSKYILGAGGRNPQADKPFTLKNGALGSDCIGFVLWCWGLDRYQPIDGKDLEYPFYEGWINTDSMLMDVKGKHIYFEETSEPFPGCAVVYPSIWKNGKMIRMGHIGLVVAVPENWPKNWKALSPQERKAWCKKVTVIDCAGAASRKLTGKAVGARTAEIWAQDGTFVRYKNQAPEERVAPAEEIVDPPKLVQHWLKLLRSFLGK